MRTNDLRVEGCRSALADPLQVAAPGQQVLLLGSRVHSLIDLARRGVFATAVHHAPIAVGDLCDAISRAGVRGHADAYVMDPCNPSFPDSTFDFVFVDEDLATDDLAAACRAWTAVLRPDGQLIATGREVESWIGSPAALAAFMDAFGSVEVDVAEWLTSLPLLRSAERGGATHRWLDALDRASLRAVPFVRRFAHRLIVRCRGAKVIAPRSNMRSIPATPAGTADAESGAEMVRELSDPQLARWKAVEFLSQDEV